MIWLGTLVLFCTPDFHQSRDRVRTFASKNPVDDAPTLIMQKPHGKVP
jgi:hypothetical protein